MPDRARASAVWFTVAAACLLLYPALRPWGAETGTVGADTFADLRWPISHTLAMIGFVAIALALREIDRPLELLAWVGAACLLPYYGAEGWALHALGDHVRSSGDVAALAVAEDFRYDAVPVSFFGVGLVLLAVTGVLLAVHLRHGGLVVRVGSLVVAAGLLTYAPQFFGPPALRVGHGVVLAVGLAIVAAGLVARRDAPHRPSAHVSP
ncbi:hypothetical protein ACHAAC_12305 [Aeromicrobium sp. CF4.19]|uniref:hypothetical protein n=1 Tax=Aeromicrobium sp. CF4.19 TaxID=3373082 RepID=UPI003EE6CCF1